VHACIHTFTRSLVRSFVRAHVRSGSAAGGRRGARPRSPKDGVEWRRGPAAEDVRQVLSFQYIVSRQDVRPEARRGVRKTGAAFSIYCFKQKAKGPGKRSFEKNANCRRISDRDVSSGAPARDARLPRALCGMRAPGCLSQSGKTVISKLQNGQSGKAVENRRTAKRQHAKRSKRNPSPAFACVSRALAPRIRPFQSGHF